MSPTQKNMSLPSIFLLIYAQLSFATVLRNILHQWDVGRASGSEYL